MLSAPADTGGNDQITLDEAELLGWILGDGHINHASRTVNVWIYQSKPHRVEEIDGLLRHIPHSRYDRGRRKAHPNVPSSGG